jgi:hypothetical protein
VCARRGRLPPFSYFLSRSTITVYLAAQCPEKIDFSAERAEGFAAALVRKAPDAVKQKSRQPAWKEQTTRITGTPPRMVSNDYVVRFECRHFQILRSNKNLPRPKGKVTVLVRLETVFLYSGRIILSSPRR